MRKGKEQVSEEDVLRVLYPGREVAVLEGRAHAVVYPLGLRHARKFGREIVGVISAAASVPGSGAKLAELGSRNGLGSRELLMAFAPSVLDSLIELLAECVEIEVCDAELASKLKAKRVSVLDLPHWDVPPIAEAWLEESFLGGKWRAWVRTVEDLIEQATGTRPDFTSAIDRLRSTEQEPAPA